MEKPIRPFKYIEAPYRAKNTTARNPENWNKLVLESIEYDKKIKEWESQFNKDTAVEVKNNIAGNISKAHLVKLIVEEYENINHVKFNKEGNAIDFIYYLIDYHFEPCVFGQNESNLLKSKILTWNIGSVKFDNRPTKSNFIVGSFGLGKSSIVKSFQSVIFNSPDRLITDVNNNKYPLSVYKKHFFGFIIATAKELIDAKENNIHQYNFYLNFKNLLIDDLFTEEKSFGKEVLKNFLEQRYDFKECRTHIICNYPNNNNEIVDLLGSNGAYQERYGDRLYDRFFEMFNIVELRGVSKRN